MAKPRLCEIIAVVSGKKGETQKTVADLYHKLQKPDLFDGLQRTYKPRTDDGEKLPGESKNPQLKVRDAIAEAVSGWSELFDLVLTLDVGNCSAIGELTIGDKSYPVPVTTLLFLQKQLEDVRTFVSKLPTLDPAASWIADPAQDMYRTEPHSTARTKKIQRAIVKYDATPEHPAQTEMITEDVVAGDWTQINYSTKLTAREKVEMLSRVGGLITAVKTARERANTIEVEKKTIGGALLSYVFGK
jgi:hypothetical protein